MMSYQSSHLSIANSPPTVESAKFFGSRLKRLDVFLLIETALVTAAAILVIRTVTASSIAGISWFLVPCVLVAAALVPTVLKACQFPKIGLGISRIGPTFLIVCKSCAVVFPATFFCLWLLNFCGLKTPLPVVLPQNRQWFSWILYQFMYVAVAEEIFFRGYLQSNILSLLSTTGAMQCRQRQWISIVLSAACFAIAHVIVLGQVISALTFLPGLILGWLFIRTRTLLAPILFHALANIFYCVIATVLV